MAHFLVGLVSIAFVVVIVLGLRASSREKRNGSEFDGHKPLFNVDGTPLTAPGAPFDIHGKPNLW